MAIVLRFGHWWGALLTYLSGIKRRGHCCGSTVRTVRNALEMPDSVPPRGEVDSAETTPGPAEPPCVTPT